MKLNWHQSHWDKISERKKKLKEGEGWKLAAMICKIVGHEWEHDIYHYGYKCKRCGGFESFEFTFPKRI